MSKKFFIAFFFSILLAYSCTTTKICKNCGVVEYRLRDSDIRTGKAYPVLSMRDRKLWFYDSLVIAEGTRLYFECINGDCKTQTLVDKYFFINLRTCSFYEFSSLSDTARLLDKYKQPDSGRVKGGWNFFDNNPVLENKNISPLPDTIIDGHQVSRVIQIKKSDKGSQMVIGYIDCKTKIPFSWDLAYTQQTGCKVIKLEFITNGEPYSFSSEIKQVANDLDQKMIHVFEVWRKSTSN